MPSVRDSYQEGHVERASRAKGPDHWIFRWWERSADGRRIHRSKLIGTVDEMPTMADARRAVESFRATVNAGAQKTVRMTVREAWEHFQKNELNDPDVGRSPSTIQSYHDYFRAHILPKWANVAIDDVKAVAVEQWLRSLDLAPGSKAKIRNDLSALFSHLIRHELYTRLNPIASVRQSAQRLRDPDILTLDEIRRILANIGPVPIRVMVAVAAASGLRRSEVRGLKWADLDLDKGWFRLERGLVREGVTRLKTRASRKPMEMHPALAELLRAWRKQTPYSRDQDWVFASEYTRGERPYWPDTAMKSHVRPAAVKAGLTKRVTWHVFRHSLGTLMNDNGENLKTIQELLRHANSRITADVYLQGDTQAKRVALSHITGIFPTLPAQTS